jgi:hypothetical protein
MPGIGAAIAGIVTAFKATAIGTFLTGTIAGRLLATVALSALQAALAPKPTSRDAGITTEFTAQGGTNPCGFILGTYATAGDMVCPPMTHGATSVPNAYLTYVITLGDIAGQTVSRVAIDGAWVTLGAAPIPDTLGYGQPATGRYAGNAWFKFYDGSQTTADPMLLAKYGTYPERPWTADMIGRGTAYVICTFKYNRELFGGLPDCLFECAGIKAYDPRRDTSVGGSGTQRWASTATWEFSANNAVLSYNIARGITIPDLGVWGGGFGAEDLPLANWFTAMNECDITVGSPALAQYRAGYEVRVDMEPAAVIEELLKGCTGQIAEVGGALKIRVGGPGLPVFFITDDDMIVSRPQDHDPFPGAEGRQNGIDATYPEPEAVWEQKSAPSIYNATWEAEDGERRVSSLTLPACPYGPQVQRIMASYIRDERRFRRHGATLPPDAAVLEPLDAIVWTSTRNSYASKLFEVGEVADDTLTILQRVALREADPGDYAYNPADQQPYTVPSFNPVVPPVQTVPGFAAPAYTIADNSSLARRPAIRLTWDGADQDDVSGLEWEVYLTSGSIVTRGSTSNVLAGEQVVTEGILPSTTYNARVRFIANRPTAWTAFVPVTTASIRIGSADLQNPAMGGFALNPDPNFRDVTTWSENDPPNIITITDGLAGDRALRGGPAPANVWGLRFPVLGYKSYRLRALYRKSAAANGSLFIGALLYDANGSYLGASQLNEIPNAGMLTSWREIAEDLPPMPPNAAFAQMFAQMNFGGTTGTVDVQAFSLGEQIAADFIKAGGVEAYHISAQGISGDSVKFGFVDAKYVRIQELLKIDSGTGALSVGKNSTFDLENDGVYFGRTAEPGGGFGFGFIAGKKVSGVDQFIQATQQNGLTIVNADYFVTSATSVSAVDVTTSQTITLAVGTRTLDLQVQAGGGGGMAGDRDPVTAITPATDGGDTVVQLWDGTVNTGVFWTATGGLAATTQHSGAQGYDGQNSAFGTGGADSSVITTRNATGYGAGGAGSRAAARATVPESGDGGLAGQLISIAGYDVSALANPKLVITIGAKGNGATNGLSTMVGGNGSAGIVKYVARSSVLVPAGVLPIRPTFTGTIVKANAAAAVFPDLGAGYWVLFTTTGLATIDLELIETHQDGTTFPVFAAKSTNFISDKTPVDVAAGGGAVTISYHFYKLTDWV